MRNGPDKQAAQDDAPRAESHGAAGLVLSRGSRALFVRHCIGLVLSLAGTIILPLSLGLAGWGYFATALFLFTATEMILANNGISAALIQAKSVTPQDKATSNVMQLVVGAVMLAFSLACSAVILLASGGRYSPLVVLLPAVGVATLLLSISMTPLALMAKDLRFTRVALVEAAGMIALFGVCIALAVGGAGVETLGVGFLAKGGVCAALGYLCHRPRRLLPISRESFNKILVAGWPVALSNTGACFVENGIPLISSAILGTAVLGLYRIAYTLVNYPRVIAYILGRVLFGILSSDRPQDVKADISWKTYLGANTLLTPLILTIGALAPVATAVIFRGPDWSGLAPVLLLAALHWTGYTICHVPIQALIAAGRARTVAGFFAVYSVALLVLTLTMAGVFGPITVPLMGVVISPICWIILRKFRQTYDGGTYRALWLQLLVLAPASIGAWYLCASGMWLLGCAVWIGAMATWLVGCGRSRYYMRLFIREFVLPRRSTCVAAARDGTEQKMVTCSVCGQEIHEPRVVESKDASDLYQCTRCHVQFWWPCANPGGAWYDDTYAVRHSVLDDRIRDYYKWARRRLRPGRITLLDVGCGEGTFVAYMKRNGFDAYGIDFSERAVRIARRTFGLETVHAGTLTDAPELTGHGRFDAITAFEVLEHQEQPAAFLDDIRSLLKQGGYLVLSVPNRDRWPIREFNDYPPHHLLRWDRRSLGAALEHHGFEVLDVTTTSTIRSLHIFLCHPLRICVYRLARLMQRRGRDDRRSPAADSDKPTRRLKLRQVRDAIMWLPTLVLFPIAWPFFGGYNVMAVCRKVR